VIASFPKYRISFLGDRRLSKLLKYTTRLFFFAYAIQWVPGSVASSRFTIPLSFRCAPLIGNMLRMKTLLKYTRIRLASSFNCIYGSCARRHFYRLFGVFFSLQLHLVHVCMGRDTIRTRICTEIQSATPLHRAIVIIATLRADIARLCCRLPLSPRWPLRRSRTRDWQKRTASFRCWKYLLFHRFFLVVFFFGFMSILILVLTFITVQTATAATFTLRVKSLMTMSS